VPPALLGLGRIREDALNRPSWARSLLKKAASPGVFAGFVFDDLG